MIRFTFQVTAIRGKLQTQNPGEENIFFYVDLSPLFAVVENLAEFAAIRSDLIHRGVAVFRGILKKIDVRPVLTVQITSYFAERAMPLSAYVNVTVDYLFQNLNSILPVGTQEKDEDEIPFHLQKNYLKFLLRSCQSQLCKEMSLTEEEKGFVFC